MTPWKTKRNVVVLKRKLTLQVPGIEVVRKTSTWCVRQVCELWLDRSSTVNHSSRFSHRILKISFWKRCSILGLVLLWEYIHKGNITSPKIDWTKDDWSHQHTVYLSAFFRKFEQDEKMEHPKAGFGLKAQQATFLDPTKNHKIQTWQGRLKHHADFSKSAVSEGVILVILLRAVP